MVDKIDESQKNTTITFFNISPTGAKIGEHVRATTEGGICTLNQVCVSGVAKVGEDVKGTVAGIFNILPLGKECVSGFVKVGDETAVTTAAGIFNISPVVCVDDKIEENSDEKIRIEESEKIHLEDSEDAFQPEILKVCTEDKIKLDASDESRHKMITIRRDWNSGVVTFIRDSKIVLKSELVGVDDNDVVFLAEISKSR